MEQQLRRLTAEEITPAMDLVWRVFSAFEAPEYSAEGIAEFRRFIQNDNIMAKMCAGSMILWGFFVGEAIVGVMAVTVTGHINLLFVDSAYHRLGIAKALHLEAETYLLKRGVASVTVNSSPYAVVFYRRFGFTPTNTEQTVNGIRFTPMTRVIEGKPAD